MLRTLAVAAAFTTLAHAASAATAVTPTFQNFNELPNATFGGSGIPNDPAAWSQFTDADTNSVLTIGLIATQRFSNPALGNDGAGTYTATTGSNFGGAGQSSNEGALWNFNWYIDVSGSASIEDFNVQVRYDLDAASGNELADLGTIDIAGLLAGSGSKTNEGSQNLFFGFLASGAPGVTAPGGAFDAQATGEYSFAITSDLGDVAINVNVVPVPAALPLLASAFGIAALVKRRSRRA